MTDPTIGYASEAGPPSEGRYSPQDFEVVAHGLRVYGVSRDEVHRVRAALARIKEHTEGLARENERMESIVDSYVSMGPTNQEAREMLLESLTRITELEAGLREIATLTWNPAIGLPGASDSQLHELARSLLSPKPDTPTCPTCGLHPDDDTGTADGPCTSPAFHTSAEREELREALARIRDYRHSAFDTGSPVERMQGIARSVLTREEPWKGEEP